MLRLCCLILMFFCLLKICPGLAADVSEKEQMLAAYGARDYGRAFLLAGKNQGSPEGRLVLALCRIHYQERQDLPAAFALLRDLCSDESCPEPVRVQALMACARTAQLVNQRQEVFGDVAAGIDYIKLYRKLIEISPKSREACQAALFIAFDDIDSGDSSLQDRAFAYLETFCADFKGDKKLLVPIHLYAEFRYIILKSDYRSAMKHLLAAHEAGIANPKEKPIILYRIGRIYDLKLNDQKNAMKYYREFEQKYPESVYLAMVQRFEREMQNKGTAVNGKD